MLQAENLYKQYEKIPVIRNLQFRAERGEMVAIVGPSGAGKSTLLHILGAIDRPDQGTVLIDGVDLFSLPPRKLARFRNQHIGFVFQFHHLLPEFNAWENVAMPVWVGGHSTREGKKRAEEALEQVGLKHRMDHKPSELSGGEQQRVAIARAMVNRPSLILADEPTGNLDSRNTQSVHALFEQLRNQINSTFILVTHNEELAARADRICLMKDGRLETENAGPILS